MFGRIITVVTLAASIALLLLFQSTSPSTSGPGGIFAAFFLLFVIFVGIFTWLVKGISVLRAHVIIPLVQRNKVVTEMSMLHAYYYGSLLALGPLMLIGMASVGSIGIYEALLVIVFEVVAPFYTKKRLR